MIDKIERKNTEIAKESSAAEGRDKSKKSSDPRDVDMFKQAMGDKKENAEGKMGKTIDGKGKNAGMLHSEAFSAKQTAKSTFSEKSKNAQAFEKSVTSSQKMAKENVSDTVSKDERQSLQQKESAHSDSRSQQTVLKQNVMNQVVGKMGGKDALKQSGTDQDKGRKMDAASGVNTSARADFSAQMAEGTSKAAPIDRQALMDQVNKIADYISANMDNTGATQSMTITFKNDVLADTSLTINRADDGAFELNFESSNKTSMDLISNNKTALLESLNNNTHGHQFQVKLDK